MLVVWILEHSFCKAIKLKQTEKKTTHLKMAKENVNGIHNIIIHAYYCCCCFFFNEMFLFIFLNCIHNKVSWAYVWLSKNKWFSCTEIMFRICNEPAYGLPSGRSWFSVGIIARGGLLLFFYFCLKT